MKGIALLIKQYPLPRCTKLAPRRALRRRRQPSSGWPRWTRRAARRGRPPCAQPWRWASGRCALARCLACLFMCTFTTHSASDMPPSRVTARHGHGCFMGVYPVTTEDISSCQGVATACFCISECSITACACARARMPRSRTGTRGCALSRRLRRAAPRPRALRPTGPRARRTPCWYRWRRSRVRSGGSGQRPPRRRAPLDAMGRRPCGCPASAGAASAARPPRPPRVLGAQGRRRAASATRTSGRQALHTPRPAVPGAHRPLRRRRSMAVRALAPVQLRTQRCSQSGRRSRLPAPAAGSGRAWGPASSPP